MHAIEQLQHQNSALQEALEVAKEALETCRNMADSNNDGISFEASDEALTFIDKITKTVLPRAESAGEPSEPRQVFLDSALHCGAVMTGKPDASEPITIVFSMDAWRKFDVEQSLTVANSQPARPDWKQIIDNVLSYHEKGLYSPKTAMAKLRRAVDDLTEISTEEPQQ